MGERFDKWKAERSAKRAARKAEKEASRQAKQEEQGLFDTLQSSIEKISDDTIQERVGISASAKYHFPSDLSDGAEAGYPLIRFGIGQTNGTKNVSIILHQPPGLTISDGANYTSFDAGTLKSIAGIASGLKSGGTSSVTDADIYATALLAKDNLANLAGGKIDKITSAAALKAGIATNPYTRTGYESTNVRGYTFNFKLVASNQEESDTAVAIERTFRKFLYPKRAGSVALVYPPLFNIQFLVFGEENEYMPKIKPSYLTALETSINETSVAIHEDSGAPIEVDLSLTFQEERVLVRQDLYPTDDDIEESSGYYSPKGPSLVNT